MATPPANDSERQPEVSNASALDADATPCAAHAVPREHDEALLVEGAHAEAEVVRLDDESEDQVPTRTRDLHARLEAALRERLAKGDDRALLASVRAVTREAEALTVLLARVDLQGRVTDVLCAHGDGASVAEPDDGDPATGGAVFSAALIRGALASGRAQFGPGAPALDAAAAPTATLCVPSIDRHSHAVWAVLCLELAAAEASRLVPRLDAYARALARAWTNVHDVAPAERSSTSSGANTSIYGDLIGNSQATRLLRQRLERVFVPAMAAPRPDPILILGPTGTGKELIARFLHARSNRARQRFVPLNCASFSGDVLESTLFGHTRGAFTGAVAESEGLFIAADRGVLFLDELGDMPPQGQSLLLRALETRRVRPIGGRDERNVNVQLICATNKDLEAEVQAGRFREDLYHRVRGLTVRLLPLRERRDDIPELLSYYLRLHEARRDKRTRGLTREVLHLLLAYPWPGNVRELSLLCSVLVVYCPQGQFIDETVLEEADPAVFDGARAAARGQGTAPPVEPEAGALDNTLEAAVADFERTYVIRVGAECNWNKAAMARRLGLDRRTLYRRLHRFGLLTRAELVVDESRG